MRLPRIHPRFYAPLSSLRSSTPAHEPKLTIMRKATHTYASTDTEFAIKAIDHPNRRRARVSTSKRVRAAARTARVKRTYTSPWQDPP